MPQSLFSEAHTELVSVLRTARKKSGLTQAQLAARVGKGQRFISLIERSQRRVDVVEFYAIARALNLSPARLYAKVISGFPRLVEI